MWRERQSDLSLQEVFLSEHDQDKARKEVVLFIVEKKIECFFFFQGRQFQSIQWQYFSDQE